MSVDIICKHKTLQGIYLEICVGGFYMHIKDLHQSINCEI